MKKMISFILLSFLSSAAMAKGAVESLLCNNDQTRIQVFASDDRWGSLLVTHANNDRLIANLVVSDAIIRALRGHSVKALVRLNGQDSQGVYFEFKKAARGIDILTENPGLHLLGCHR